jgi:hypothetical protein
LALVSWRWGGGYSGGEGWGLGVKGRGVAIFYRRPVLTSITLAFFKSMCSAHSPCAKKGQQFQNFEVSNEKKTYKGCFFVYNG